MISPTPIRLLIVRVSDKKTTPIETAVSGSSDPKMELVVAPAFFSATTSKILESTVLTMQRSTVLTHSEFGIFS